MVSSKKLLLGGLAIATVAVTVAIVLLVLKAVPLITGSIDKVDFESIEPEIVGLDDLKLGSFIPIAQLFIGEAVKVETPQAAAEPSQVSTPQFSMTVPAGWAKTRESASGNTFSVLLENADGDFATVMSVASVTNPDQYIQDFISKYKSNVERAGFVTSTYRTATKEGYSAYALDADSSQMAVRVRAWFDNRSQRAYIVVLNARPGSLSASEAILQGPSQA